MTATAKYLKEYSTGISIALILALAGLGYLGYQYHSLKEEGLNERAVYENRIQELEQFLDSARNENENLNAALTAEKERNDSFENQIEDISGSVGQLEKLAKIDPELLQKYSKVYFLNENYFPSKLENIPDEFVINAERDFEFHAGAIKHLEDLMEEAADDNVDLKITSAYRSFGNQADLKANYRVTYGTGANTFSADQGYSEHQLGTTIDFTTKAQGGTFEGFDQTEAFSWLTKNAHKYGFILSYPAGNAYYQYEPWHWRYVGVDLAEYLEEENLNFYDMDQRDIDKYLIKLFD